MTGSGGVSMVTENTPEDEHHTLRLLMFEVYEAASPNFPLFITSDSTEAHDAAKEPGDHVVRRYWVREGLDRRGVVD